jgi:hypothetical protein
MAQQIVLVVALIGLFLRAGQILLVAQGRHGRRLPIPFR